MSELLAHELTLELIKSAQQGDGEAQERLICCNLALVKSIVRGYLGRGAEYDDLVQIGSIGLIKAIKNYDSSYNVRFSTYAVPMISGEIKRFLRDDGIIKVSRSLKENSIKVFRAQEQLKNELMREPDLSELSERTGMSAEDITEAMEAVREPVSIYEPVYQDSAHTAYLLETLPSDVNQEASLLDSMLLKQLLDSLGERERRVILLRFFRDRTQSEIASAVGVSQVQVSRIITKTLAKLKELSEN